MSCHLNLVVSVGVNTISNYDLYRMSRGASSTMACQAPPRHVIPAVPGVTAVSTALCRSLKLDS